MTDSETTGQSALVQDDNDEDTSEAQAQVIASLRAQVTDLFSQVTQLNGKLVASYDRMSDLEDQLHDASASLRTASVTISSLELERSHHLAALNTGLLVEKAHVTAELNRLMERATEEAAQRGQAESARHDIEKDLDDLSATLFDQANTMVAEARLNQAKSERKVQDAEQALKFAEDAVKDMQVQMQSLHEAKEAAERDARDARLTVGKGKWIERDDLLVGDVPRLRFLTTHVPYAEFIAFVGHLRGMRASQPAPPLLSTLLAQPFIARLLTEDSEPTVRLDLAPSLNWLSRRSVLTAIHAGMLTVEPLPFSSFVHELQLHPQSTSSFTLSCALCGSFITRLPSTSSTVRSNSTNGGSWFKYSRATQNHSTDVPPMECEPPGQIYIFRLAPSTPTPPPALQPVHTSSVSISSVGPSSRPSLNSTPSSRVLATQTQNLPYPLCTSNYCLSRLRSTCSLWAFVRVGIVERIWEEDVVRPEPHLNGETREPHSQSTGASTEDPPASRITPSPVSDKPPVPPRRRKLWEMASVFGERAASWGKESAETSKEKGKENEGSKALSTPPPSHPSAPHPHPHPHPDPPASQAVPSGPPPPLPKRNVVRDRTKTGFAAAQLGAPTEVVAPKVTNGHKSVDKADPASPVEPIAFATPPSPPSSTTSEPNALPSEGHPHPHPSSSTTSEPIAPPAEEHPRPPSPHNIPLPTTPTTSTPASRAATPVAHSGPRISSSISLPPNSRPATPTSGSRAGSPAPTGTAPKSSANSPVLSHIRGKSSVSMSSPLASPRTVSLATPSGPRIPPVPRRAPARRAVPPVPPATSSMKSAGNASKEAAVSSQTISAEPTAEVHGRKSSETDLPTETKPCDDERGRGASAAQVVSVPDCATEVVSESFGDANAELDGTRSVGAPEPTRDLSRDDRHEEVNDPAAAVASEISTPDPTAEIAPGSAKDGTVGNSEGNETFDMSERRGSESHARSSMDTTSTRQSSNSEDEGFAGDATWEERTWKELMRLKEEMFWARIGGVRALHG